MRNFWQLFLAFILLGCASKPTLQPLMDGKHYLVENCRIYNMKGELIKSIFSGVGVCAYNSDGSFAYSNYKNEFAAYDANLKVKWKHSFPAHHQINRTTNGDYLLLSSENALHDKKSIRHEVFYRVGLDGKVVGKYSMMSDALSLLKEDKIDYRSMSAPEQEIAGSQFELSHANSIYEIPENKLSKTHPELAAGNIIVNMIYFNKLAAPYGEIFIFDSGLTKIVKRIPAPVAKIHDVQVNEKGEIILYNNYSNWLDREQENFRMFSSIDKFEYPSMKRVWSYGGLKDDYYYSKICGGVQFLDNGLILFTDQTHDAHATFITKDKKVVQKFKIKELSQVINMTMITGFQQMKVMDISDFMKNTRAD